MKDFLRGRATWAFMAFFGLFAACMLWVFAPVLPTGLITLSPDYGKYYPVCWQADWLEAFLAGDGSVFPWDALNLLGSPLWRRELFFMVLPLGGALGTAYLLRARDVGRLAAYGAGLLFAFAGYSFTLFNAGHAGYFELAGCVAFAFGLLARCFKERKWFHFAMLGAVAAWSEAHQPDVWFLFMSLLAAYGIWLAVRCVRREGWGALGRTLPRFALTAAVAAVIGGQQIRQVLTETVGKRKAQMSAVAGVDTAGKGGGRGAENWDFATGWSMPPEDIAEFAVAGIWGDASFAPPEPYWGRLGRPHVFEAGKMMPNYRQHTLYLGMLTLLLAFAGVAGWNAVRRGGNGPGIVDAKGPDFGDVPFWLGTAVVCTLFALGRYAPVYRAFYSLPYMNLVRCPVKFHHLTELAVACLAGFGLEALVRQGWAGVRKKAWVAGIVAAAGCGIGLMAFTAAAPRVTAEITRLGLGQYAASLARYGQQNLGRAIALAAVATALLAWLWKTASAKTATLIGCALVAIGTMDLAAVARRYVDVFDVSAHHAENAIVLALEKQTGCRPALVMNYVTQGTMEQDWLTVSMGLRGYPNVAPAQDKPARAELFGAFRDDPPAYWGVTGARFVLLPYKYTADLAKRGALTPIGAYDLDQRNRTVRGTQQPGENAVVLSEVKTSAAFPALFSAWQGNIAATNQVAALRAKAGPRLVSDAPAPTGAVTKETWPVTFDAMRRQAGVLATHGTVKNTAAGPSLLVFSEEWRDGLKASVDGRPVPVYEANAQYAAILIPPGEHMVRMGRAWHPLLPATGAAAGLAMLAWGLIVCLRKGKAEE